MKPPLAPTPAPVTLSQLGGTPVPPLSIVTPTNANRVTALTTLGTGALDNTIWRSDGSLVVSTAPGLTMFDPITGPVGDPAGPAGLQHLVAALPDGRLLLSNGSTLGSSELTTFNLATGAPAPFPISGPLRVIWPQTGSILALRDSPQGVRELVLLEDGGARTLLTLDKREPSLAARSSDGTLLALDAVDYRTAPPQIAIDILALPSGQVARSLTGFAYVPEDLYFVPGSSLLVVRENGGTTSLWDATDGRRLRDIGTFVQTVVAPDGTRFAAFDGVVLSHWELPAWRELPPLPVSPEADVILADAHGVRLSFSPDSTVLLASSSSGLAVWQLNQLEARPTVHPFTAPLRRVAFTADGAALATAGGSETILWDLASGLPRWRQAANLPAFTIEPGGQTLLLSARGPEGDQLLRRDIAGVTSTPLAQPDSDYDLTSSPTGKIFTGSFQAVIALRDAASGAVVGTVEARPSLSGGLSGVAGGSTPSFSPDGTLLAAGVDEQVRIWDVVEGRELRRLSHESSVSRVQQVVFSPDSQLLASVTLDSVRLWHVAEARQVGLITAGEEGRFIGRVAFSPDGLLLAAATWLNGDEGTGEVRIFEVASGRLLTTLSGHLGPVRDVAFAPTGVLLASVATDGIVRLWGVAND